MALFMFIIFWGSPAVSPNLIVRFYRGRQILRHQAPRVYTLVNSLAARAGLENAPVLYFMPTPVPNAVAVGTRKRSGIALSEGLLRRLDMSQLSAVLAHEISHITNNDLRRNTLAAISVRLTHNLGIIGQFLLLLNLPLVMIGTWQVSWILVGSLILSPVISHALVMALSRVHEYQADLQAVELTSDPQALASALLKLDNSGREIWRPWLKPRLRSLNKLGWFNTHPATRDRILRLQKIWQTADRPPTINRSMSEHEPFYPCKPVSGMRDNPALLDVSNDNSTHWGGIGEGC
jgi:heat shock protein HtpX